MSDLATGNRPEEFNFDRAQLLARVDGDEELMLHLVSLFVETVPRSMASIQAALIRRDLETLLEAIHSLDNSVGVLGETRTFEMLHELTTLLSVPDWPRAFAVWTAVEQRMSLLEAELRRRFDL